MTISPRLKNNLVGDKSFYIKVVAILLPIVIQNTVTNVVSLLDNIMVGSIGTLQMSAVAIVNQLLFVFYLAIFGGYAGAGIFSAQYVGAKDNEGIKHCFRMKLYIGVLVTAIALAVFIILPDMLISSYLAEGTSPAESAATLDFGIGYLKIMLIGLPAFALSQVYGSTLREMGETRVPMIASVVAIVVNLVFNYIFIFGNEGLGFLPFAPMGVAGAAIATVISRFVEAIIILVYVHLKAEKYPFIKGAYKSFKIPVSLTAKILSKGSPLLINEVFWSVGMAALMQCYSRRGIEVVAATNIATTANNLFNVVFLSIGSAIAIIVGQQLGANEVEKAKTTVWRLQTLSIVTCIVMGGLLAIIAPFIPEIYNTTDQVKDIATNLLFVVAAMMPFYAFAHGCYFTLRSGGKTLLTLIFDCGFIWGISYPTAFLLAKFTALPIIPLYLAVQLIEVVKCVLGAILVKKGIWINNIVSKGNE